MTQDLGKTCMGGSKGWKTSWESKRVIQLIPFIAMYKLWARKCAFMQEPDTE